MDTLTNEINRAGAFISGGNLPSPCKHASPGSFFYGENMTYEWRKKNPVRAKLARDKWREENKEKIYALAKTRRDKNPIPGREYAKKWNKENKEKHQENKKTYYQRHKKRLNGISLRNQLKRDFGITLDDYNEMALRQSNVCAICGNKNKNNKRLCVDHDHETGFIRGLLCTKCNVAIGLLGDSSDLLLVAINYLKAGEDRFQELIDMKNNREKFIGGA